MSDYRTYVFGEGDPENAVSVDELLQPVRDDLSVVGWYWPGAPRGRRGSAQCSCGRFARWVGDRTWFDGNYSRLTMTVECSRCGTVEVDLI